MVAINKSETKKNGGQSGNRESSSRFNNLWNTKVTIVLIVSGTLGVTLRKGWKNIEIQGLPRGLWRRWIITVTISVKTGGGEMISYNRSHLLAFLLREVFHCCRCRHPIIGIFIFFSYFLFPIPFLSPQVAMAEMAMNQSEAIRVNLILATEKPAHLTQRLTKTDGIWQNWLPHSVGSLVC